VQVAVDYQLDVLQAGIGGGERGESEAAPRAVVRIDLGVGAHSAVKQQQPVRMVSEAAQARLNSRGVRTRFFGWPGK
jgi:hypothetical protein